jgi:hypothetical protein
MNYVALLLIDADQPCFRQRLSYIHDASIATTQRLQTILMCHLKGKVNNTVLTFQNH